MQVSNDESARASNQGPSETSVWGRGVEDGVGVGENQWAGNPGGDGKVGSVVVGRWWIRIRSSDNDKPGPGQFGLIGFPSRLPDMVSSIMVVVLKPRLVAQIVHSLLTMLTYIENYVGQVFSARIGTARSIPLELGKGESE